MKARFTQSFKIQAVEKALERANDVSNGCLFIIWTDKAYVEYF